MFKKYYFILLFCLQYKKISSLKYIIVRQRQMFEDRHLNFSKFVEQRAQEISKFRQVLKLQTKKKGHQSLPKSIRRRAMSHNRYRIPSKLRKLYCQQLQKNQSLQRVPKCRKSIRKSHLLIQSYKCRASKIKWLSTHLWSAKRMKMIDYYGYKVAETPNQKMFRTSYRHFKHNACLADSSYYQQITININSAQNQLPNNIVVHQMGKRIIQINDLKYNRSYQGLFYSNQSRLICPIFMFKSQSFNGEQYNQVILFFHPSALSQIQQINFHNDIQVKVQKTKAQMYFIVGPQWSNKIYQALTIYGSNITESQCIKMKYQTNGNYCFLPKSHQKVQKIPYTSDQVASQIKDKYQASEIARSIKEKTLMLLKQLNNKKSQESYKQQSKLNENNLDQKFKQFWRFYQQKSNKSSLVNIKITNRSKYTHKRKNKLSKQTKKKLINLQKQKRDQTNSNKIIEQVQSLKHQIKHIIIQQKIPCPKDTSPQNNMFKVSPIMISPFKRGDLEGAYLFCSDQNSCRLWRILTKLNVKVIGLHELEHIYLETSNLAFPNDYPTTNAFKSLCQRDSVKQHDKARKRSIHKSVNYVKINSANPLSRYEQTIALRSRLVFIQMVSLGRCFSGSYIFQPTNQDMILIHSLIIQGNIGMILTQTHPQNIKNSFHIQTKRKLIGRITTGGYLFAKAKEGGIGYIADGQVYNGYVLVRKVTSPGYFLGQVTMLYQ